MLALSIRQPWAWLILHAGKDIENRSWPTKVRGRVLIHASKGMTRKDWSDAWDFAAGSGSRWFVVRFGFVLRDPIPLPTMPWKWKLGFFDVPESALPSNA